MIVVVVVVVVVDDDDDYVDASYPSEWTIVVYKCERAGFCAMRDFSVSDQRATHLISRIGRADIAHGLPYM
jgi:hypothetical protein